ncbi:oligogalacturonide transporter [Bifidobacterium bohemicum]|uniref:Uncharacterized protein n=2 Tax=Bifidobacterium bohemicum TaxID=638617 RepID=A0A086ZDW0_9BIFI|nr:hypothetical protein BBOH_1432 [Bifidobacterium bohemicum DSM 22767]SCC18420.1 oligogalacturonide transporter [Bifidobacterium bohemicum]
MPITAAQSVLGLSVVISGISALVFGVLDGNLFLFGVGRRFGRRHFFMLPTMPFLLIGMLMWVPDLPLAMYAGRMCCGWRCRSCSPDDAPRGR